MRVAVALGLVLCLLGALPGGAQAGGRVYRVHEELWIPRLGGPDLTAGGGVAWANPHGSDYEVTVAAAGRRTVQPVPGLAPGDRVLRLAASARRVALGLDVFQCEPDKPCLDHPAADARVFAGALGGRLWRQPACPPRDPSVDVSGDVIAYMNRCAGGATVRDLSAPATAPVVTFPARHSVRVAGRYVAVDADTPKFEYPPDPPSGKIRVYDRLTGGLVYTVDAPVDFRSEFDIRDDGTIVFTRVPLVQGQRVRDLARASPSDPVPRTVAYVEPNEVRLAGDDVAIRDAGGIDLIWLYSSGDFVSGGPRIDPPLTDQGFDFDGDRLAFAVHPCEVTAVVVWDLEGAVPALSSAPCPNATPERVRLRGRRLRVTLRCVDPDRLGCGGAVDVQPPDGSKRNHSFAVRPGGVKTIQVGRLPRRVACAIAARRQPRAVVQTFVFAIRQRTAPEIERRLPVELAERPSGC